MWVRSMAGLVDLMITSLLTLAIVAPLEMLFRRFDGHVGSSALFVYALYAAALIARTGRTAGMWLFELEVVDVTTGRKPSLRRAAIRASVPVALPCLGAAIGFVMGAYGYKLDSIVTGLFDASACIPAVLLLWASLRSVSKQTIWDKRSRTMVRYRTRRAPAI
jgi:uncharacterized RDD family membrane protein YckC